ncbi:type VII secretion system-associated protein [Saccharopolyspora sp. K220]|uniref:type VII secretion system-associated protein n=1 Tax=Saccharopolyspora soli TaxID=2926618 RepID=UPI001F586140|nr:type VII secretion system-associated protein [Saccharopolyspora soli]MCI2417467.1 type VII secretion system-associated protein [Saccharopolyspora soli]
MDNEPKPAEAEDSEPDTVDAVWAVVLDPSWQSDQPDQVAPPEVMVGGWLLDEEGRPGKFFPNPDYTPSGPDVPTDPTHAVMKSLSRGESDTDDLLATLRDSMLDLGLTENGELVLAPSPDEATCALVASSPAHHRPDLAAVWQQLPLERILDALPDGVDILLNPGAQESMRLMAEPLRDSTPAP